MRGPWRSWPRREDPPMSDNNLAFGFIPLPVRPVKPRDTGVTMVLDKGLSVADARELVSSAGPYIDLVKLGWGTARLMPRARVAEKVRVYLEAEIEVCPGGTFLEVAAAHGLEGRFFEEALALGFSCIEVFCYPRMKITLGAIKVESV